MVASDRIDAPRPHVIDQCRALGRIAKRRRAFGDGAEPRSGGEAGLRVVRVLEALQQSLRESSRAARV